MELEIHEHQSIILRELLFKPQARFRDLNKANISSDLFTFHLNKLVKEGLIIKDSGKYTLSTEGKEFANRMDTESLKQEKQAKIGVALHAVRMVKGKREYLIHQRLKEPFFGWYGSHTGKIRWGEQPMETAQREFLEETGLTGDFIHKGIVHILHFHRDGRLLEDKYFFVYKIENTKGVLMETVKEGKNIWMSEKEFRKLKETFATYEEISEVIDSKKFIYLERKWIVDSY